MYMRCDCEHLAIDHTSDGCYWCECSLTSKQVIDEINRTPTKSQVPLDKK